MVANMGRLLAGPVQWPCAHGGNDPLGGTLHYPFLHERTAARPVTGTLVLAVQVRTLDLRVPALALESVARCRLALRRLPSPAA
jgi:hypothetical protein